MKSEPQAIEVEVVEVDGVAPLARSEPDAGSTPQADWQSWGQWQGRVRQLDSRWWPLWVLLGAIVVTLLLVFGVVIGVLFVMWRIVRGILQALLR